MHFEVEKSGILQAVFDQYSKIEGLPLDSFEFTFKNKTVQPDDSPAGIGMSQDENIIQVSIIGHCADAAVRNGSDALTKEAIVQACTAGSMHMAVDLLSQNEDLCTQPLIWHDSDGLELSTPPIFICIDYGHAELVANLLLLHNTDILNTLKGGDGDYSALQWASWTGNLEIVKILVEEGRSDVDDEALSLAREYDHNEVAEYLLKHIDLYSGLKGDSDAIMEKACREGDLKMVHKLLDVENYNIDKWKDEDGKCLALSPLHLAVMNCHVDLIQLFAERGFQMEIVQQESIDYSKY